MYIYDIMCMSCVFISIYLHKCKYKYKCGVLISYFTLYISTFLFSTFILNSTNYFIFLGISFDFEERDRLGMRGLVPPVVRNLDSQVSRNLSIIRAMDNNLDKNLHLQNLHNRNETLYHRLLVDHLEEIAPLIYTPTVGEVGYTLRYAMLYAMLCSATLCYSKMYAILYYAMLCWFCLDMNNYHVI